MLSPPQHKDRILKGVLYSKTKIAKTFKKLKNVIERIKTLKRVFIADKKRFNVRNVYDENKKSQSNFGRVASPPLMHRIPLVTMVRPTFNSKTAPSSSTISTPSNTPILRPTQLSTPNGIQIQSAVVPQFTVQTDR